MTTIIKEWSVGGCEILKTKTMVIIIIKLLVFKNSADCLAGSLQCALFQGNFNIFWRAACGFQ